MGIASDYLQLMQSVGVQLPIPPIQQIYIAAFEPNSEKSSKFGAMALADGTVGLTYTGLDDDLITLQDRSKIEPLINTSPVQAASLYTGEDGWQRVLGLAAINAISQYLFKRSDYTPPAGGKTVTHLDLHPGDHVGMVGFFPPLVEQVRELGLPLTVIELDQQWLQNDDQFEVTLDPKKLSNCNKIICTGTVLINQTIEDLLPHCVNARQIFIVGPTVGCLPDPLFDRGITRLGGCAVLNTTEFLRLWAAQEKWRNSTRRYVLSPDSAYPGCTQLLKDGARSNQ
ncbi:MAG: hypothetical protein GY935_19725 [Gammaproteobacteria bacterium]|nr:hypothetical protein [Gammaproteobacteria bacterium]